MKKLIVFSLFFLVSTITYSQTFKAENGNFINLKTNEISIEVDDFTYEGLFEKICSKKDKNEYLIFSYFSRCVVVKLDKNIKSVNKSTPTVEIEDLKIIHSNNLAKIKKDLRKKGYDSLDNHIIVYSSSENRLFLRKAFSKLKNELVIRLQTLRLSDGIR